MDKLDFKGRWGELRGKLKHKYPALTDEDLLYESGQEEQLLTRLQKKLGVSRDDIVDQLGRF